MKLGLRTKGEPAAPSRSDSPERIRSVTQCTPLKMYWLHTPSLVPLVVLRTRCTLSLSLRVYGTRREREREYYVPVRSTGPVCVCV